jgi:enamine deaminase RidA (YjgF/YER057c/UK114 family)
MVRQYIVRIEEHDYKGRVERYMTWMGDHTPPSTLIGVAGLATKEMLYEIEVMAVVSG